MSVYQLNGLNGFFRNLWNGFKSATGLFLFEGQDNGKETFGYRVGRFLAKISVAQVAAIVGNVTSKTSEYEPTQQELTILNPIVSSLNNWLIDRVSNLNGIFSSGQSLSAQMGYLNNTIRILQILRDYYGSQPLSISTQAHQYLSEQIDLMVQTFEATIEDLLSTNTIVFDKTEGDLSKSSSDSFPTGINVPAPFLGYGVQYKVAATETAPINASIPSSTATDVVIREPNIVTNTPTGGSPENPPAKGDNNKIIAFGLIGLALFVGLLSSNNKDKK